MLRNVASVFVHRILFSLLSKSACEEKKSICGLLLGSNSTAPQQMQVLYCVVFIVIFVVVFLSVFSLKRISLNLHCNKFPLTILLAVFNRSDQYQFVSAIFEIKYIIKSR